MLTLLRFIIDGFNINSRPFPHQHSNSISSAIVDPSTNEFDLVISGIWLMGINH